VPRLAEYVAALGLWEEVFEDCLRFFIDLEHSLAGPALEPALDDEIAPVAILVGILADNEAIFFEVQHLHPRNTGVARENRRRAQRLFGIVNPELISICVEDVLDLAFVLGYCSTTGALSMIFNFRQA
jgi:hypothetical protein